MQEFRCWKCKKLLGKHTKCKELEIKCPRCGQLNYKVFQGEKPAAS